MVDREFEAGAFLGHLRRGQVDGEPPGGELEAGAADRGADTLARLQLSHQAQLLTDARA